MTALLIDGKAVAARRRTALAAEVARLIGRGTHPCLVAVGVQNDAGWAVYTRNQAEACASVGIRHRTVSLSTGLADSPGSSGDSELAELIEGLNADPDVHGIILQQPFPPGLDARAAAALLSPGKDVEGAGPANLGLVLSGRGERAPCTAIAAVALAREVLPDLTGVEAVVVGASTVVGKPIAQLLIAAGATVTTCQVQTRDLAAHTARAELLIVAVGKAGLIRPEHVRPGAVVIDVGINRISVDGGAGRSAGSRVVGDVAPEVAQVARALSPVPGGVGALTTTILLEATARAAQEAGTQAGLDGAGLRRVLGPAGAGLDARTAERLARLIGHHLVGSPGGLGLRDLGSPLLRRLRGGVFVLDGAMGTALMQHGIPAAEVVEAVHSHPDLILDVHRAHAAAGAMALTAATFGANPLRLHGDRERAARIAGAGVRLARQAAARGAGPDGAAPIAVLGSLGPTGSVVGVEVTSAAAEDAFAVVALACADAGADGLIVETAASTAEALAALAGARRVCRLPVLVCRTCERDDAAELAEFAAGCEAGGAAAIGINCAGGPRSVGPLVQRLARLTTLPVIARPNAGAPSRASDGSLRWHLRPDYLLAQAQRWVAAGVAIVGGCCGVGPEHIAALTAGLRDLRVAPRQRETGAEVGETAAQGKGAATGTATDETAGKTTGAHPLVSRMRSGDFALLATVPARLPPAEAAEALARLARAGADAIGLTTGWPGTGALGARLAARLRHAQDRCGAPGVLELVAGALSATAACDAALAAHLLGVRLCLIDAGVFGAPSVDDARDLVALIARLNAGRDPGGTRLDEPTAFAIGVRVRIDAPDRLPALVAAGADFLIVQPVYEPARFRAFMDAVGNLDLGVPLLAAVLLLPDRATAEELDNELPALSVPLRLQERLASDPEADVRGVLRFLAHWRSRLAGLCLLLPDGRTTQAERVLAGLRR